MRRFLLPLAMGTTLLATTAVAADVLVFPSYFNKNTKQLCLVPTGAFDAQPRVYWSAITPKGKCSKDTVGGTMNIRYRHQLAAGMWKRLKEVATALGVDANFKYVHCKTYQGKGSKLRYNFVVTLLGESQENVESGWLPPEKTGCEYPLEY